MTNWFKFLFIFYTVFSVTHLQAGEIYKWIDKNGKIHYSTKPHVSWHKPAKLPEVQKEDLDAKIAKIKAATPKNCSSHGGVDCSLGADKDGSVICLDGYREAVLKFKNRCLQAKLEKDILVFFEASEEPERLNRLSESKLEEEVAELKLFLRNKSDVTAHGIRVDFNIGGFAPIKAEGPDKIESFAAADFNLDLDMVSKQLKAKDLQGLLTEVTCVNCSSIRTARY